MMESVFRQVPMPQFSAGPSGVRPQRRKSGNSTADQAQRPTRNGAAHGAESARRRCPGRIAFAEQSERASGFSPTPAHLRALTPPGTLIRLASKNRLKTGAWTVLRVQSNERDGASRVGGMESAPMGLAPVGGPRVRWSRCARSTTEVACGLPPPQPPSSAIGRGTSLAGWESSPGTRYGALQESQR